MEQYRALAKVSIGESELRDYATRVFGESTSRTEAIVELHETGLGADLRGVRGSLWGAYNAVTEYLSWKASRTQDARLSSLWYGPGAALNAQALSTALEDGAGGGVMRQRMWLLMAVDVETHHDAMGNAVDPPAGRAGGAGQHQQRRGGGAHGGAAHVRQERAEHGAERRRGDAAGGGRCGRGRRRGGRGAAAVDGGRRVKHSRLYSSSWQGHTDAGVALGEAATLPR